MIYFENIKSNFKSYNFLIDFYHRHINNPPDSKEMEISMENVKWMAANTCSIVGAIFQKLLVSTDLNTISLIDLDDKIQNVLERNGFLAHFGLPRIQDPHQTTIRYMKLSPQHKRNFSGYIQTELMNKSELPTMTNRLKRKIMEGIYEIFINATMHSESDVIFTCGQYFPRKHLIEFMITDIGVGIKNRVNPFLNADLPAVAAIEWAMKERNTTKTNDSGGLGLSILTKFIYFNKGKIQIISNEGFWEFSQKGIVRKTFCGEFPGTAVNIAIKTNDPVEYSLYDYDEDVDDDDIF